jgi:integrase
MMKAVERVPMGRRGQGVLVRFEGSANWVSCYCLRGKEHRESTGTPDLKKAKRFHKQRLDELAGDRQGLKTFLGPVAQRVRVGELLDDLERDYGLRQVKSWASIRAHMKPIAEHFGTWRAVDITAEAVDTYVEDRLEAGKAAATINRELQPLGQALRLALLRHKVTAVPPIRRLPERNTRQGFFERPEFELLVTALPEYLRDVCRFGYCTGWRRGEILGLRWPDVDLDGGAIRLRTSKNGRGRLVVFDDTLRALMERRWQARLTERGVADLVFHNGGAPIVDFRRAWGSACIASGLAVTDPETGKVLPDRLFHDLRRTAIRNMVRAGVPERVAMEISGHRTRAVFDRYNIVSETDLREATRKTDLYVAGLPTVRAVHGDA